MDLAESYCVVAFKGMSNDEVVYECVPIWCLGKGTLDENTRLVLVAYDSTTESQKFTDIVHNYGGFPAQEICEARFIQEARDKEKALAVLDTANLDFEDFSNDIKENNPRSEKILSLRKHFTSSIKSNKRVYQRKQHSPITLIESNNIDITYQDIINTENENVNKTTESILAEHFPLEDDDTYHLDDKNSCKNKPKGALRKKLMKAFNENVDECLKTVKKMTRSALSALYNKMMRKIRSTMSDSEKKRGDDSSETLERIEK